MANTEFDTIRIAGMPDSGYPAEVDSTLKVRWVSPLLTNMSERSADLLKYFGGPEKFTFNTSKVEWVEDDKWNRRLVHSGLTNNSDVTLPVPAGTAHRYPVGTLLYHAADEEVVRVNEVDTDAGGDDLLTITRDITSDVSEGAWSADDEVFVVGFSMHEDDNWAFRPTAVMNVKFNYPQIHNQGVQASYRRVETNLYGLQGNDLDYQAANTVAEQFVAIEMEIAHGKRFAGASGSTPNVKPSMQGGVKFYVTSANGAQVVDLANASLTRRDINDILQELFYSVGPEKMAKTIICGAWPKQKISSFFSATERTQPGTGDAGVVVEALNTDFGRIDIIVHTAVAKNEMIFIRREQHSVGHHGTLGRPQLRELPTSLTGPRIQKVFYCDLSSIHMGPQAEGRIVGINTSA
jgi:hypothetical protein